MIGRGGARKRLFHGFAGSQPGIAANRLAEWQDYALKQKETWRPSASMRSRKAVLPGLVLCLLLTTCSPESSPESVPDRPMGGMMSRHMGDMQRMPGWMMSDDGMMIPDMMQDMRSIHGLLINHDQIERKVEDIPNGVRTTTTSENPQVAQLIREHVRQMKALYARGQPIRVMDPVFRELFRNRKKASLNYDEILGGVRVMHTSEDPQVVLLIRQHARGFVSEAAREGMRRAMRPTPLPNGYRASVE